MTDNELVTTYEKRLTAYIRAFEANPAEAEEIAQATWVLVRDWYPRAEVVEWPEILICCRHVATARRRR